MFRRFILPALGALALLPLPASAQSAGDWALGIGGTYVVPDSADVTFRGVRIDLQGTTGLAATGEYFITDWLGVDLFLAATNLGSDPSWLPPAVGLNYHFRGVETVKPFVGAGLNYGTIAAAEATGGIIDIRDSFGPALQAGFDIPVSERDMVRVSARYFELDFQVDVAGRDIGNATLAPVLLSVFYMRKF